jgi:hypothetical protein
MALPGLFKPRHHKNLSLNLKMDRLFLCQMDTNSKVTWTEYPPWYRADDESYPH